MARQVVVNLVGDSKDFERAAKAASKAAEGFESDLKGLSQEAAKSERSMADLGEKFDDSEQPIIGLADVMDGLATTMGLEGLNSTIQYTRGIADMASGIGNGLIPVVTGAASKVKTLSAAMLASPTGKLKLGLVAAAAATAYVAAETGNLNKVLDAGKGILKDSAKGWDMIVGKLLGVVGAAASATVSLEDLQKAGMTINGPDALAPKGGGVSVGDLKNYTGNGAADWASKNQADRMRKASEDAVKAAQEAANRAAAGASKAAESAADKVAKAANDALTKRFDKQKDILSKALDGWADALRDAKGLRDRIKGLFDLDVKNDDPLGLVHGLKTQASNMKRWVDVIKKLQRMGFRDGLVNQLIDRGPSSLADAVELSHVSRRDVNKLYDSTQDLASGFSRDQTLRRTGVDVEKPRPVKVTLDVKGSDKELVNLIKKWVRTEGGGNVQVAFGKGR